jgi:hypothetical protein
MWGREVLQVQGVSPARPVNSNPASGNSICHWTLLRMLRLALALPRLTSYPLHRLFSNRSAALMETESTGTHRDPVTGELISKQYVHIRPNVPLLIDSPCLGSSSAAKSSVKKRQGGRTIPQIAPQPRTGTVPRTRLRTKKIFRLMYVGHIDICTMIH